MRTREPKPGLFRSYPNLVCWIVIGASIYYLLWKIIVAVMRGLLPVLEIALVLTSCGGVATVQPRALDAISLNAADWFFSYGTGNPPIEQNPTGGIAFNIPPAPAALGYLKVPAHLTARPQFLSITFRVEASPDAEYNAAIYSPSIGGTDANPAMFHLFLERRGDDVTDRNKADYRQWADIHHEFGTADNQTITLQVPLTQDHWSQVFGMHTGLEATLGDLAYVGLTFGGRSFFGHGIQMARGTARVVVVDYRFVD